VQHLRRHEGGFHRLGRLASDEAGNLYIADARTGAVYVRAASSRLVHSIGGFGKPSGLAAGGGKVYVGDSENGSVTVFDSNWQPLRKLGQGDGEFKWPASIAVDPDPLFGYVYVADSHAHMIKVYDHNGDFLHNIGTRGTSAAQFNFPVAVYVSPYGDVFVADQANDRVQVLDRNGIFQWCFKQKGEFNWDCWGRCTGFGRVVDITGDTQGRIYLADALHSDIMVFDPFGALIGTLGEYGNGPGQFRTPVGMTFDIHNRFFVASVNTNKVEAFGIDAFTDPYAVEAFVDVTPDTLRKDKDGQDFTVYIEVPERGVGAIDRTSVTANGVAASPERWAISDYDSDGLEDLKLKFPAVPVCDAMSEPGVVLVRGRYVDDVWFEASDTVRILEDTSTSSGTKNGPNSAGGGK
jgi:DNA-binding beta-propeller fold protein YncE